MNAQTTRRAVLGAMGALPALIAAPAVATSAPAPDTAAWDAAMAHFQRATAILEVSNADEHGNAWCDAATVLMETPSPHPEALLWKLEHMFGDIDPDGFSAPWCSSYILPTMADARRLLGSEARP